MKKTLIALMALSMLSIGAAQAAEKRPVSNFLNKLEAKEEAARILSRANAQVTFPLWRYAVPLSV